MKNFLSGAIIVFPSLGLLATLGFLFGPAGFMAAILFATLCGLSYMIGDIIRMRRHID